MAAMFGFVKNDGVVAAVADRILEMFYVLGTRGWSFISGAAG